MYRLELLCCTGVVWRCCDRRSPRANLAKLMVRSIPGLGDNLVMITGRNFATTILHLLRRLLSEVGALGCRCRGAVAVVADDLEILIKVCFESVQVILNYKNAWKNLNIT